MHTCKVQLHLSQNRFSVPQSQCVNQSRDFTTTTTEIIIICVWVKSVSVSLTAPKARPIKSSQQMTLCRNETWKTCYRSVPSAAALASIIRRHFRVIPTFFYFIFVLICSIGIDVLQSCHAALCLGLCASCSAARMYLLGKNIMKNNHYHFVRCCDYDCHLIAAAIHHRFSSILRFFLSFLFVKRACGTTQRLSFFPLTLLCI